MRILVISHNVFSNTESMGKTLSGFFEEYPAGEVAQLYFHSQVPTVHISETYYRITDKNILKSILTRRSGRALAAGDIEDERADARTDAGLTAAIYQKGRARTPLIFSLRNTAWRLGKWNTPGLRKWLEDFDPEIVFFASGDYSFSYDIALKIAKTRKIPLVVSCMDDYYFYNHNQGRRFGGVVHRDFMKHVKAAMQYAGAITCICEKMTRDYQHLFGVPCYTLHTAASIDGPLNAPKKKQIAYLGNLGYDRYRQLIKIGRCLKKMQLPDGPHALTVYSSEPREEIVSQLTPENGIDFRGAVSAEEVRNIMAESLAVVHTEAFDEKNRNKVRYSVSTKIADSLMSGTCIFAFGPADVASMEYLIENRAAVAAVSDEELEKKLADLINNRAEREAVIANAQRLAQNHHTRQEGGKVLCKVFGSLLGE